MSGERRIMEALVLIFSLNLITSAMSTTTTVFKDIERFTVTMHVNKKQEKLVNNFFKRKNVKPTADCLLVSKTFGNIDERVS